jgi:hypothetical protein
MRISNIPSEAQFVSDSQDVSAIKEYLGNKPTHKRFNSFFIIVGNGEYDSIWGMEGIIPWLYKIATKLRC